MSHKANAANESIGGRFFQSKTCGRRAVPCPALPYASFGDRRRDGREVRRSHNFRVGIALASQEKW